MKTESLICVLFLVGLVSSQLYTQNVYNITTNPGGFAEGVEYNSVTGNIIFGSGATTQGYIRSLSSTGAISIFVNDSRTNLGTFGIELTRNNIYFAVCNLTGYQQGYTAGVQSGLGIASATTGVVNYFIDLTRYGSPTSFANDVTVTPNGIVYVTDTSDNLVWVVNTTSSTVVTIASPLFNTSRPTGSLGVNGIKYINSYVITCAVGSGIMFKINPTNNAVSIINGTTVLGCDGIRVTNKSPPTLIITNTTTVSEIGSIDDFASAVLIQTTPTQFGGASTNALVPNGNGNNQTVYVTEPFFGTVIDRSFVPVGLPSTTTSSSVPSTSSAPATGSASSTSFYFSKFLRLLF